MTHNGSASDGKGMTETLREYYPVTELPESSIFRRVGEDLTLMAKDNPPGDFSAREPEMRQLVRILGRRAKANPMILGDAGVGKTFLVRCLAWMIVQKNVPEWLLGRKVIRTSFYDVQAGVPGTYWEWGAYVKLLKELLEAASKEPVVLFIDEIHQMFGHPHSTNILKPYIAGNRVKLVGATTTEEYHRFISRDEAVVRRFQEVRVAEPEGENLRRIVLAELEDLKRYYRVEAESELAGRAIKFSEEYLPFRRQPDKTIDLIEQAFTGCRMAGRKECGTADLRATLAEMTGIPRDDIASEREKTLGLELALNRRVLGQEEAIAAICRRLAVTRSRVQVNPERPLGVFLIAGPSGVGKTELAKALALLYTGSEDNLVRIDMSVYQDVYSLLGAPRPGNADNPDFLPPLTMAVRRHPHGVLLLDEFEKANQQVCMTFLQVFDYGRLTDMQGSLLCFGAMIVVMTCNVGFDNTEQWVKVPGFGQNRETQEQELLLDVRRAVEQKFPREFLGRLDDIIIFRPLTPRVMDGFIAQKLGRLSTQLGKSVTLSPEVIELVRKQGFSEKYGARPLNRAIDAVAGKALAELKMTPEWEAARSVEVVLRDGIPTARVKE